MTAVVPSVPQQDNRKCMTGVAVDWGVPGPSLFIISFAAVPLLLTTLLRFGEKSLTSNLSWRDRVHLQDLTLAWDPNLRWPS